MPLAQRTDTEGHKKRTPNRLERRAEEAEKRRKEGKHALPDKPQNVADEQRQQTPARKASAAKPADDNPPRPNRFLRLPEVKSRVGLGTARIYELMAEGEFPRPYKLSLKAVGWLESQVDAWINCRIAARDEA